MLYTRKGDNGTTKTFGCDQRISKSSTIAEALGAMDEVNSYLGLCKVKTKELEPSFEKIIHDIQKNLFIVQAELAGATESISENKVKDLENIVDDIEKQIPKVESFFISGGCEFSAMFDFARTLARCAERRVVAVHEEGVVGIGKSTLEYLNRLSSVLYALARLSSHLSNVEEESPDYK
jgi:cob(I)alamin adenosyltransferase|tara:strand:- start:24950 stop:25486 length:537 start_codon:yes stop_codon:yes gene_type:complete